MCSDSGKHCLFFDVLDSTNEEAKRLARLGKQGPLWVVAKKQSAGRGRRGRTWVSDPGNLYASLIVRPGGQRAAWPQISFVSAVALYDAISGKIPVGTDLACKWPNDLLLKGKKLAGILLESEQDWLVIGIGVNVAHFPETTDWPATSLAAQGYDKLSPNELLDRLAAHMKRWLAVWEEKGFAPVRDYWLQRAIGLGEQAIARLHDRTIKGRFVDLTQDGALLLEQEDGDVMRITAGDIFPQEKGN